MKRILACLFITAVLPLLASTTQNNPTNYVPFSTVAYAGHTSVGSWCACGTSGCICDPGEEPIGQSVGATSDQADSSLNQGTSPSASEPLGFDFGSGALLFALAFLVWSRLRA